MNFFNAVAAIYSDGRPGYPEEIYRITNSYANFSRESSLLEIGAGSGIATREILRYWRPKLTAIEPGENLLEIARGKSGSAGNVSFINTTFEDFQTEKTYDGIFSATAFHWLDKSTKYQKSHTLLKDEGFLILFWNNYLIADDRHFMAIQEIYDKFHFDRQVDIDVREIQKLKIKRRRKEIAGNELFDFIVHKEVIRDIPYPGDKYIKLLKSFSTNAAGGPSLDQFYEKISEYIKTIGNEIKVRVLTNLEIAKKK